MLISEFANEKINNFKTFIKTIFKDNDLIITNIKKLDSISSIDFILVFKQLNSSYGDKLKEVLFKEYTINEKELKKEDSDKINRYLELFIELSKLV